MTEAQIRSQLDHAAKHDSIAWALVAGANAVLLLTGEVRRIADAFQAKPKPPADSVAGRTVVADD